MTSRLLNQERDESISKVRKGLENAPAHLANFVQSVKDVQANLAGYVGTSPDANELSETSGDLTSRVQTLFDDNKAGLAEALTIIAGRMVDQDGNALTLQDVLDQIAAVDLGS